MKKTVFFTIIVLIFAEHLPQAKAVPVVPPRTHPKQQALQEFDRLKKSISATENYMAKATFSFAGLKKAISVDYSEYVTEFTQKLKDYLGHIKSNSSKLYDDRSKYTKLIDRILDDINAGNLQQGDLEKIKAKMDELQYGVEKYMVMNEYIKVLKGEEIPGKGIVHLTDSEKFMKSINGVQAATEVSDQDRLLQFFKYSADYLENIQEDIIKSKTFTKFFPDKAGRDKAKDIKEKMGRIRRHIEDFKSGENAESFKDFIKNLSQRFAEVSKLNTDVVNALKTDANLSKATYIGLGLDSITATLENEIPIKFGLVSSNISYTKEGAIKDITTFDVDMTTDEFVTFFEELRSDISSIATDKLASQAKQKVSEWKDRFLEQAQNELNMLDKNKAEEIIDALKQNNMITDSDAKELKSGYVSAYAAPDTRSWLRDNLEDVLTKRFNKLRRFSNRIDKIKNKLLDNDRSGAKDLIDTVVDEYITTAKKYIKSQEEFLIGDKHTTPLKNKLDSRKKLYDQAKEEADRARRAEAYEKQIETTSPGKTQQLEQDIKAAETAATEATRIQQELTKGQDVTETDLSQAKKSVTQISEEEEDWKSYWEGEEGESSPHPVEGA